MKYLSYMFTLFAAALVLGGCSKRDSDTEKYLIKLGVSTVVVPEITSRSILTSGILPEGETAGVFAYSYTGDNAWPTDIDVYNNAVATIGAASGSVSGLSIASKYYVVGKKHAFYAYYPYRSTLSGKVVGGDVISDRDTNGEQIDWLCADPTEDVTMSSTPIQLNFGHMMSMLKINVVKGDVVDASLILEKFTLTTTTSQKFTLDVASGAVTSVNGGSGTFEQNTNYTIPTVSSGSAITVANILFLPQSQISSITLTINGEDFKTADNWGGLLTSVKGNYKTVNFTINMTEIVISVGGKDWAIGSDADLRPGDITTIIGVGDKGWGYDPSGGIDLRPGTIPVSPWFVGGQEWNDGSTTVIDNNKNNAL